MGEPTNNKHPKAVEVKKGKIDFHQRKQGELPKDVLMDAPKSGMEAMNLGDVDNENLMNYNEYEVSRRKEDWKNFDYDKGHDNFKPIEDCPSKKGAGE